MSGEITFITFNYGKAGSYVNGPGMCLVNFVKKLKSLNIKVNIFSELKSDFREVKTLNDSSIKQKILRSDIVHHWSGIGELYLQYINFAYRNQIKVIIGPNVLDTVDFEKEKKYLEKISYSKIMTVNSRLKYLISQRHQIPISKINLLRVGPDEELWNPISEDNGKILWKGNSLHKVKDIDFGLNVAKSLPQYQFEFLGYPKPYNYEEHVLSAKRCHLYFTTSLSETMGLTILESNCSGLPVISHPKIYLDVPNYQNGIITNRDVESYCEAIDEIMNNEQLYFQLKNSSQNYIKENFSTVAEKYCLEEFN